MRSSLTSNTQPLQTQILTLPVQCNADAQKESFVLPQHLVSGRWNKSRKTDRNPCLSHKRSAKEGTLLFVVSSEKETLSSPQIIPVTFFTATHNTQQIFPFAVIPDVKWRTETIDKGMKRRGEERGRGRGEMGGWQQVWWRLKESNTKLILHFPSFRPCLLR